MHDKKQISLFIFVIIGVFFISFFVTSLFKNNQSFESVRNYSGSSKFSLPKAYIVESGSMEPAIPVGAIVISTPSNSYRVGDVITFHQTAGSKTLVTHRIMTKAFPDGIDKPAFFQTSGDANNDFDANKVSQDQIVGKVALSIPYIGYVANFAKKPYGFILLVIVPATIIIYEELKNLGIELNKVFFKFVARFRKKKNSSVIARSVSDEAISDRSSLTLKPAVLIPLFGAVLVFTGIASAYFYDNEKSVGNVLQAGTWTIPTPSPTITPSITVTPTVVVTLTPTLIPTLTSTPTPIPN